MLTPVKLEHSAFRARFFNAVQRSEAKQFPGVLASIALFEIPAGETCARTLERLPFFKSTPMEQRLMFGNPAINRLTPLSDCADGEILSHGCLERRGELLSPAAPLFEQFQEKCERFSVRNSSDQRDSEVHRFRETVNLAISAAA
ncbi:hypothetical protein ACVOMV_09200 [Mesorhizobium atlanticum]